MSRSSSDADPTRVLTRCAAYLIGSLLTWSALAALAGRATADDHAETPQPRRPRIALVEPIDGSGVAVDARRPFRDRLIAVDGSAGFQNRVRLAKCRTPDLDPNASQAIGATGLPISVPPAWFENTETELYRGVVIGPLRPGSSSRQRLFDRWHTNFFKRQHVPRLHFSADQIPSDLLVLRSDTEFLLGYDINANLEIEPQEIFQLDQESLSLHAISGDESAWILVQPCPRSEDSDPDRLEIRLWTPTCKAAARQGGIAATFLEQGLAEDCDWVWIDCGEPPHPGSDDVIGPADLAVAFEAAENLRCDLVCVDLARCQGEPTITARLIARLAERTKLAAIVNLPTIVSPNYRIDPALIDRPDLMELAFDRRHDPQAFSTAVTSWRRGFEPTRRGPKVAGALGDDADGKLPAFAAEAVHDRLKPLAVGRSSDSNEIMFARIPVDAVTATLRLQASFASGLNGYRSTRCYDHLGRLVTNRRPRAGGLPDGFPLLEMPRSRGGFVVVNRSDLAARNEIPNEELSTEVAIEFVRGESPVVSVDAAAERQQIEIAGVTQLPDRLLAKGYSCLRRLHPCDSSIVPRAVRLSADQLDGRSARVQSWWYRCDPRPGDNSGRFLFVDHLDSPEQFNRRHLQIWQFDNTGQPDRGSQLPGAVDAANNAVRWILVEQISPTHGRTSSPPVIVECFPHYDETISRDTVFERIAHSQVVGAGGENRYVDRYESNLPINNRRLRPLADAIWAGLMEPPPSDRLIRWLKIEHANEPRQGTDSGYLAGASPVWWSAYRDDVAVEEVQQRRSSGQTPDEIVEQMSPAAGLSDQDCLTLRRWFIALDQSEIRKEHLAQIAELAERIIDRCRSELGGLPAPVDPAVAEFLDSAGGSPGPPADEGLPRQVVEVFRMPEDPAAIQYYAWAVDALYRRFRALGYMELPDVLAKTPIKNPRAHSRELNDTLFQLAAMVDVNHPEFVLARVRRQRRDGHPLAAYQHLQTYRAFDRDPNWYFKKERDLWDDMEVGLPQRLAHARWFLREIDAAVPPR